MEHMLGGDANSLENTDKSSSAVTFCRSCDSERTPNEFRISRDGEMMIMGGHVIKYAAAPRVMRKMPEPWKSKDTSVISDLHNNKAE